MPDYSKVRLLIHDVTHTANFGDWMVGQFLRFWLAENCPSIQTRYLTSVPNTRGVWLNDRFFEDWDWPTHILIFGGSVWYDDRRWVYEHDWLERLQDNQRLCIWGGIQVPFTHQEKVRPVLARADLVLTRFESEIPVLKEHCSDAHIMVGSDLCFLQTIKWKPKTGPAVIAGHLIKEFEPYQSLWVETLRSALGCQVRIAGVCCLDGTPATNPWVVPFPMFWNWLFDCCLAACTALHAGILAAAMCTPLVLIDLQGRPMSKYRFMGLEFESVTGFYPTVRPSEPTPEVVQAAYELPFALREEYAKLKAEQARRGLGELRAWLTS